jgi:YD repeat-containing protein
VFIDRKNQVAQNTYDALDRLTQAQFADLSTIAYTYDAGNRVTQVVDSLNGTITRTYDGLDRLTSETTAQGSVSYTYDAAGRRTSYAYVMPTMAGQPTVSYCYDNANRLTQITQGTCGSPTSPTVTMGYDNANRRTSLTLPNGIAAAYTRREPRPYRYQCSSVSIREPNGEFFVRNRTTSQWILIPSPKPSSGPPMKYRTHLARASWKRFTSEP